MVDGIEPSRKEPRPKHNRLCTIQPVDGIFIFIYNPSASANATQKFEFSGDVGDIGGICKIPWHYLKEF